MTSNKLLPKRNEARALTCLEGGTSIRSGTILLVEAEMATGGGAGPWTMLLSFGKPPCDFEEARALMVKLTKWLAQHIITHVNAIFTTLSPVDRR